MNPLPANRKADRLKDVATAAVSLSADADWNWFPSIPLEWKMVRFKCLFRVIYRYPTYFNIEYVADGIPEIRGEALTPDGFIEKLDDERYISPETNSQFPMTQLEVGDIVMSVRGTMGKIGVVDERYAGANITANLLRLSPDQKRVTAEFLRWLMRSVYFNETLNSSAPQTTIKTITMPQLARLRVALPPLSEQKRVAAFLDASCAALDAAVAAKQRQIDIIDALRKAFFHSVFAHPEWPIKRVKDITTKIGSGLTPEGGATGYLDTGIPLIRSQNVHFDGLRLDDVACISEDTHADMANSQLQSRDVLLNITGASIGRCTFLPDNFNQANVNQHVCIVRPGPQIDHRFLTAFLSSPNGQGQIFSSFTGASRQGLSHKDVGLIRIPHPPPPIQRTTVDAIGEHNKMYQEIRGCITSQISTLLAYRKSLIHECVTGQRRVTEEDIKKVSNHG